MQLHANAALSLKARQRMVAGVVEQGRSITEAAEAAGVSERTCSKWVSRYRAEGDVGLLDRSSAPRRGLSDEVCVVVVTDSALVAGKDRHDHQDHS